MAGIVAGGGRRVKPPVRWGKVDNWECGGRTNAAHCHPRCAIIGGAFLRSVAVLEKTAPLDLMLARRQLR